MSSGIVETNEMAEELAHLARLSAAGASEDVRLFLAKLVRKYRPSEPNLAAKLENALKNTQSVSGRGSPVLRRDTGVPMPAPALIDRDSQLPLVKIFDDREDIAIPLLPREVLQQIQSVIAERSNVERLRSRGLRPTKSIALVGAPGVGKTHSARWLASQLEKPLWVLDLTAVMSSLLGRTGHNLRAVLDSAKEQETVLLLDEFDAIGKRRGDEADVGELKRVVTVMLQEIDLWPDKSMLIAATNYPELVDPALWRRFDVVIRFPNPTEASISQAIARFLQDDAKPFAKYVQPMAGIFVGQTLAEVERAIGHVRRCLALSDVSPRELLKLLLDERIPPLLKSERMRLAMRWAAAGNLSHREIHEITGVSRDTIRKHVGPSNRKGRGMRK